MNPSQPPIHYHPAHYAAPAQAASPHAPQQVQVPRLTPLPPPAPAPSRDESDVRWVVGWIRDLLVIAMSLANLMHVNGGH